MMWLQSRFSLALIVVLSIQLITTKANALSEDLMEVNNNPEQVQMVENQRRFKEKCDRASESGEAFVDMQEVKDFLSDCTSQYLYNASAVEAELYAAQENGNLGEVIREYCDMRYDFTRCFGPFMKGLENCMETEEERKFVRVGTKFMKAVSDYVCQRHGFRTRNLIQEGGLQCLSEKTADVLGCFHQTKSLKTMFQASHSEAFVFEEQKCIDIVNYEHCVVETLKTCNGTSAVDFHNGLFKSIKRILPCDFSKQENLI